MPWDGGSTPHHQNTQPSNMSSKGWQNTDKERVFCVAKTPTDYLASVDGTVLLSCQVQPLCLAYL